METIALAEPSRPQPAGEAADVSNANPRPPASTDGYLAIPDADAMAPFLMSVVSDSDFWLFIGSNGGITAGRVDPDHALFPYLTADRILERAGCGRVLCLIDCDGEHWEPWSAECKDPDVRRNLYKHETGTSVIFEEIHQRLGLRVRWEIGASERFGLLRRCELENLRTGAPRDLRILDGWTHLLPNGVSQDTFARYSYLAAAYMRHEALPGSPLAVYTLNSGITDRAEPSESLRVACAWSLGLENPTLLISEAQVPGVRRGARPAAESEVRGLNGAHLVATNITLAPAASRTWWHVADTRLDHTQVVALRGALGHPAAMLDALAGEFAAGVAALRRRIAGGDALQQSGDRAASVHHFANVLFNSMRGGTLHDHDHFPREDFRAFLRQRNTGLLRKHSEWVDTLPARCPLATLNQAADATGDAQLARLAGEYLPISFGRRHGDPSRPWNRFAIHTKDTDGNPILAYAGNWRDIFQNWESLAHSYPMCFEAMIAIFLNASTADGYNPYRITRSGIDWEVFDPADPWSHIGYWGDHQIIYLLRLLEGLERHFPDTLANTLGARRHCYARVPYQIRSLHDILADPKHTIDFDKTLHHQLTESAGTHGGDARLLAGPDGEPLLVTRAEKLLVPALVKLTNLIPGGGIWLNTQRPEWNDANNALAGWGLSVVTVCHLRRYLAFLQNLFAGDVPASLELTNPVAALISDLAAILPDAATTVDDAARHALLIRLGIAGERHRTAVYSGQSGAATRTATRDIRSLIDTALAAIDVTMHANRRGDGLFHSYNLLEITGNTAAVHHLELMLEGQVAAIGSGALTPAETARIATAMRASPLFRDDQQSYMLYPDREIRPFLERNTLPADWAERIPGLASAARSGDRSLIRIDASGSAHFHPDLANVRDLRTVLDDPTAPEPLRTARAADRQAALDLWEDVFHHRAFTGRSGAMFAFEGLGSIYWHMVAKLLLAVAEAYQTAVGAAAPAAETNALAIAYDDIRAGLGFTKDARTYGAFPSDPYSHTPRHAGAQQPGMTGQVKEEILTRMGELGVIVRNGRISFRPTLLKPHEFTTAPHRFHCITLDGRETAWNLPAGTLAFTYCQTPVCYEAAGGGPPAILLERADGRTEEIPGDTLSAVDSAALFRRENRIRRIRVRVPYSLPLTP